MKSLIGLGLIFLTLVFLPIQTISVSESDLINGPGYADVKDVFTEIKGNLTCVRVELFEPLPTGISLLGRLYVDSDSNSLTGSSWVNERGADCLIVFTQREGVLFRWKENRFERVRNLSVSFLGASILIEVPGKYVHKGSRVKLWVRTTTIDPTLRSSIRLTALTMNYTTILVDGVDNIPAWMDLLNVRGWLREGLRLLVIFRGEAMPLIDSSSVEVMSSYSLMIDSDGDPKTGFLGAEYKVRLLRLIARRPFLELMVVGELYRWNSTSKKFDVLISEFPGYISGNIAAYRIPLKEVKLDKSARLVIFESPSATITDYFPDNYFRRGWYPIKIF